MCGIAGGSWTKEGPPLNEADVRRMTDVIRHRGPDDEGFYTSEVSGSSTNNDGAGCRLGFRRLSIIDLSTGHQPLSNENGTIWIAHKVTGDPIFDGRRDVALGDSNYRLTTSYHLDKFGGWADKEPAFKDIVVNQFIPIYKPKSLPQRIDVHFGSFNPYRKGSTRSALLSVSTNLQLEDQNIPRYFPPIMGSVNMDLTELGEQRTRGDARRRLGDIKGAIECYMACYKIQIENHHYVTQWSIPLKAAAQCYDKLGDKAKAQELRKLIPKGDRAQY